MARAFSSLTWRHLSSSILPFESMPTPKCLPLVSSISCYPDFVCYDWTCQHFKWSFIPLTAPVDCITSTATSFASRSLWIPSYEYFWSGWLFTDPDLLIECVGWLLSVAGLYQQSFGEMLAKRWLESKMWNKNFIEQVTSYISVVLIACFIQSFRLIDLFQTDHDSEYLFQMSKNQWQFSKDLPATFKWPSLDGGEKKKPTKSKKRFRKIPTNLVTSHLTPLHSLRVNYAATPLLKSLQRKLMILVSDTWWIS